MSRQSIISSMDLWFLRNIELTDDEVQKVFDNFFMHELPTEENKLWKLYHKAGERTWYRNGRLATKREVELCVSDMTGVPVWGELQNWIYTWIQMTSGRKVTAENKQEFKGRAMNLCDCAEEFTGKMVSLKKFKGVSYPEFEPDEKDNDTPIEKVLSYVAYNYKKNLYGDRADYRRAFSIGYKYINEQKRKSGYIADLSTSDKVMCRKVYEEMLTECSPENMRGKFQEQTREICERLLSAKGKELQDSEFVYKIISTLKAKDYEYCSDKQRKIIDEALEKLNKAEREKEKKADMVEEVLEREVESKFNDMYNIDLNDLFN